MNRVSRSKFFQRFWAIAGSVSIRTKVLGIVLALVLLLGLGVTLQVRSTLSRTLRANLQEQGISIARDVAARSTDLILVNDLYALHQLLQETQTNNSNIRYAFVVDTQGQVLAHTFGEGFPVELLDANTATETAHHNGIWLRTDEGDIWDVAVPIFDGRAGNVRIGLTETSMQQAVNAVTGQMLLTTILVSTVGIAAATFLTWILTRPILDLVKAAQTVGKGDLTPRVTRWADDEIGDLAEAFNSMTKALAEAAQEQAERDKLRVRYVSSVITAQEEERKRIARELHDGTGQTLTSLLVGLRALEEVCDRPQIRQHTEDLRKIAGETLEEIHDLAVQLRPSVLDDLGLSAAVERHVIELNNRHPVQVDLAIHGLDEHKRLPPTIEIALYRIVQEALTNVVRHAQARSASVLLEMRQNSILVIVEDNGCGFDPADLRKGNRRLGLYGIQERAELLNGRLKIESKRGAGTSLFIEIPLASPPDEVENVYPVLVDNRSKM